MPAKKDKRGRATGRLGIKEGERYALMPEEVMTSTAYGAQPDFAKVTLFAVACRFSGHNNANLSIPFSEAEKLGIEYQWKLYAGLQLLRKAGLILMTRQGHLAAGSKVCSLYAITWRAINRAPAGVNYDAGILPSVVPSHEWAKWERPVDWARIVRDVTDAHHGRKKGSRWPHRSTTGGAMATKIPVSTTGGAIRSTTGGAMGTDSRSTRGGLEGSIPAPPVVDTSKTPPLHGGNGAHRATRSTAAARATPCRSKSR
jgi:hypothetical protein